jgi:molybdate transport system permease protein
VELKDAPNALSGLAFRAPWGSMTNMITSSTSLDALRLSLIASLATTVLALLFGFPLAWLLARGRFRGKALLRGRNLASVDASAVTVYPP